MAALGPLTVKVEFDLSALDNASDETLDALADKLWERIMLRIRDHRRLAG